MRCRTSLLKVFTKEIMPFTFFLLALSAKDVFAFPSMLSEAFILKRNAQPASVDSPCPHLNGLTKRQAPGVTPPFDASEQYMSNTGSYTFVAPGPDDQRGACTRLQLGWPFGYSQLNSNGTY